MNFELTSVSGQSVVLSNLKDKLQNQLISFVKNNANILLCGDSVIYRLKYTKCFT